MTSDVERWPLFDDDEIEAVVEVLRSGKVNRWTGDRNTTFEASFAEYVGAAHAIAVANGTVSLEMALRCAGIGRGDDVVVTSRSFVASAASAAMVGARPVFADVDATSQNITADSIAAVLTDATRAIIVVHLGGWIADMAPIMELAEQRNIIVVEDCAQALGSLRDGKPAGSWGHLSSWSFCQDKILTTGGEGGMLTTGSSEFWETAWSLKDHGKNYKATVNAKAQPTFRWVHDSIGTNWRMTEMQAAIGIKALPKVEGRISRRNEIARKLDSILLQSDALRVTVPPSNIRHAYYKYYTFVRPENLVGGISRDDLLKSLHERGVPGYVGICAEIYREKAFLEGAQTPQRHPVAQSLGETAVMLPIHHNLSDETISSWGNELLGVVRKFSKRD